ncbi:MAG: dipeptidase [Alphaproteobacteria bacterium]|nr:dipeptidase [Alphaproteobacteria bacterium]
MTAVFDGHNDALLRLWRQGQTSGDTLGSSFIKGTAEGQLDLPKARQGQMIGGFFAMFTPAPDRGGDILNLAPVDHTDALAATNAMFGIAEHLANDYPEQIKICHHANDIRAAMTDDQMAMLMHIEGAEAIKPDLSNLDAFYDRGLRSIGPVWSRPNDFAVGVPFEYPASPDIGTGLTDAGRALITACNKKRIMIDLSHMNEAGFWDIAAITDAPLVATHSNAHSICAASRNLTNRQLDAIAESGGLVGVNFAVGFLRPDGQKNPDMALEVIIRHLDHLLSHLGEGGLALGSDFDGAEMAHDLNNAGDLPRLIAAMKAAGFGDDLIRRICHLNWINMIERVIG